MGRRNRKRCLSVVLDEEESNKVPEAPQHRMWCVVCTKMDGDVIVKHDASSERLLRSIGITHLSDYITAGWLDSGHKEFYEPDELPDCHVTIFDVTLYSFRFDDDNGVELVSLCDM